MLHIHIVLWLKGSMTSRKMKEHLGAVDFRSKIKKFIVVNICAHLPGHLVIYPPSYNTPFYVGEGNVLRPCRDTLLNMSTGVPKGSK